MATTAEINALLEPLLKSSESTGDLQKKLKVIYNDLLARLEKSVKQIEIKQASIDLGTIIGQNEQNDVAAAKKLKSLQSSILSKIEKNVKGVEVKIDSQISLSSILGQSPKINLLLSNKYYTLKRSILTRIEKSAKKAVFEFQENKIQINDILGGTPKINLLLANRFYKLKKEILDKIIKKSKSASIQFEEDKISLSNLLGEPPKINLLLSSKFFQVKKQILSNISKQIKNVKLSFTSEGITLEKLLGEPPAINLLLSKQFYSVKKTILEKIQKQLSKTKFEISGSFDLNELLGQSPAINLLLSKQFYSVKKSILEKIQVSIDKVKINLTDTSIDLNELLGQSPAINLLLSKQFYSVKKSILEKIQKQLDKTKLEISGSFDLNDLLGQSPAINLLLSKQFYKVKKSILEKIQKQLDKTKLEISGSFDLNDLLGQSPAINLLLSKQFYKVKKSILEKIQVSIDKVKINLTDTSIDLNELLGQSPAINLLLSRRFYNVKKSILDKIQSSLDSTEFNLTNKEFDLNELLGQSPAINLLLSRRFYNVKKSILDKIQSSLDSTEFNLTNKEFDVAALLGESPAASRKTKAKFTSLRNKVLNKIIKAVSSLDIKLSDNDFSIAKLLGDTSKTGNLSKLRLNKLRAKIFSQIESGVPKTSSAEPSSNTPNKGIQTFEQEALRVRIVDFEERAEKDLSKIAGAKDVVTAVNKKQDEPAKGGSKLLLSFLGPLLLGVGGVMALFKGFDDEGPLKGAKILIGKIGVLGSLKWLQGSFTKLAAKFTGFLSKLPKFLVEPIEKFASGAIKIGSKFFTKLGGGLTKIPIASMLGKLGGKILKGLKFIPFVGSIIDFYDAYKRFKQGKWGTGVLSLLTGIVGLIPGVGTAIKIAASIGVGIFNAIVDSKQKDKEKVPESAKFSMKEFSSKILTKVTDWFKSTSIYKLSSGIYKIFTGDVGKGFEQVSGILGSLPIVGKPITSLLGLLQEKAESLQSAPGKQNKSLGTILKDYIVERAKKVFNRAVTFGTGLKLLFTGSSIEGLSHLVKATAGIPILGSAFSSLYNFVGDVQETAGQESVTGKPKGILQAFKEVVYDKIRKGFDKFPLWLKQVLKYIPGIQNIIGDVPEEDIDFPDSDAAKAGEQQREEKKELEQLKQKQAEGKLGAGIFSTEKGELNRIAELEQKLAKVQKTNQQIPVQDFSGVLSPGNLIGSFKQSPVINKATDFVIGGKEGGPIEQKLSELVAAVNSNMKQLASNISTSLEYGLQSGIKQIQPTVIAPPPAPAPPVPPPAMPPIDSGKAPSYALGKIYNQRARFYALYS